MYWRTVVYILGLPSQNLSPLTYLLFPAWIWMQYKQEYICEYKIFYYTSITHTIQVQKSLAYYFMDKFLETPPFSMSLFCTKNITCYQTLCYVAPFMSPHTKSVTNNKTKGENWTDCSIFIDQLMKLCSFENWLQLVHLDEMSTSATKSEW